MEVGVAGVGVHAGQSFQAVRRRRKTARARRQQHVCAEGRMIQRLLGAFQMISGHRGNALNRLSIALVAVLTTHPASAARANHGVPPPPPPPRSGTVPKVPCVAVIVECAMRAAVSVFVPAATTASQCGAPHSQPSGSASGVPPVEVRLATSDSSTTGEVQRGLSPSVISQLLAEVGFTAGSSSRSSSAASSSNSYFVFFDIVSI